jgi:hypothetical protein
MESLPFLKITLGTPPRRGRVAELRRVQAGLRRDDGVVAQLHPLPEQRGLWRSSGVSHPEIFQFQDVNRKNN